MQGGRQRPPTMKDVARRAGVHPSVVSRYMSGDPVLQISDGTRQRVAESVREMGYRRNAVARSLRTSRTRTIGYLIPDLVSPSNKPLIAGAQAAASARDYTVLIGSADGDDGTAVAFGRLFGEGRVDGLLVNCGVLSDAEVLSLAGGPDPVVLVNRSVDGAACSVILDDESAAYLGTSHLTTLGHRYLGHVAGPSLTDTAERRSAGFKLACLAAGAKSGIVSATAWDVQAGYEGGAAILREHPGVTAIFAANVPIGVGVLRAANEIGLAVPRDLSLVAMHDAALASMTSPSITAVATPLEALGALGAERLMARIDGQRVPELTVVDHPRPYLIERESTAPPGGQD